MGIVTAPAARMPKSTSIHSGRVPQSRPTRLPGSTPGGDQPRGDLLDRARMLVPRDVDPTPAAFDAVARHAGEVGRAPEKQVGEVTVNDGKLRNRQSCLTLSS